MNVVHNIDYVLRAIAYNYSSWFDNLTAYSTLIPNISIVTLH